MKTSARGTNATALWLGLSAFAWSLLFVWQGLDVTDLGFWLTGYQQFYARPETPWALCWLTNFIGHWIGKGLGSGVLAYNLGYAGVLTASALIAHRLLAAQVGDSRTLFATVLLTVGFMRMFGGNWVGYNELTALFYLAGAALLFFGLAGNRKPLVLLAGLVLGANVFVRFPNALGVALVAAIWLQARSCRWSLREAAAWAAWFLGGFALGGALVWGLIVLHGHETYYLQAVSALFVEAGSATSAHAVSGLLKRFVLDHLRAFAEALSILAFGGWAASRLGGRKTSLTALVVTVGAVLLFYLLYVRNHWQWSVPGVCYVVLLFIVSLKSKREPLLALLAFIAGLVLLLVPLGSTNGLVNSIYGLWLALPLTLTWLWRSSDRTLQWRFKASGDGFETTGQFSIAAGGFRVFAMTLVLAILLLSLAASWRNTYRDSTNRLAMTHPVAHSLLRGIRTTAARAKVVQELLDALSRCAKPGAEVLAYNGIPIVYFLTETHPWLGSSWSDYESAEKLAAQLRKKEESGAPLPCIVRATGSTYANSWPVDAGPPPSWWHQDEPRRVFAAFEQRHGYDVVWSNGFFQILLPVR